MLPTHIDDGSAWVTATKAAMFLVAPNPNQSVRLFKDVSAEEIWNKTPPAEQTRERLNSLTVLVDASGSGSFAYRKASRCIINVYELDKMSVDEQAMTRSQCATRLSLKVNLLDQNNHLLFQFL